MATDVLIKSFDSLQEDLNRAKSNLKGLNENIRRIIGREPAEENSRNERNTVRKRNFPEVNRRIGNVEVERPRNRDLSPPVKIRRSIDGKSVFSRLSGHAFHDEDNNTFKPRLYSRVIKELPTREEIVEAQCMDEESRARNRRMFGCLLGTLQKFCQEESRLKPKEEKKAMVEKKLEEQERKEREVLRKERQILFIDRKRQQLEIRKLESKMILVEEFQIWEKAKRSLMSHIRTKTKPPIYFKPKILNDKSKKLLNECQSDLEKEIEKKKAKLNEEILLLDDRYRLRDDEIQFMKSTEEGKKLLDGTETRYYQRSGDKTDSSDEDEYDSTYESDGREIGFVSSDRKYSRSVVVVQNNYNKKNNNSYSNNEHHYNNNCSMGSERSENDGHLENIVKEEKDNDTDDVKIENNTSKEGNIGYKKNDIGFNNKNNTSNSIKIKREKDQKSD
ncbi:pinin [Condylostylus longicornis]|uniref:pinin n=1 Tax=Condylostylus longicornis TaxID=2530218 RepID=UPI00244DB43A|nr:pinin [Condylostylus longicornis]